MPGFADWVSGQAKAGAAVAAVMAGVSAYGYSEIRKVHEAETERLAAEHGAAVADLNLAHADALREERRVRAAEADALRDGYEAKVADLEDRLEKAREEAKTATEQTVQALAATISAQEAELARTRQMLSLYDTDGAGRVLFDLGATLVATRSDEALDPMVDEFFGGRILALAAGGERMHARLPAGANARFMMDPDFDLAAAMEQQTDGPEEFLWLLGPVVEIGDHHLFRRAAPFVTVRRYTREEAGEEGVEDWPDAKPDVGLFFRAFNAKITFANHADVGLQMNVQRLEQVDGVHFAHFRTKLRRVTVDGTFRRRVFLHEILMTAPTAEGVFEVNATFLSPQAGYASSEHWPAVMEWLTRLRIHAT